MATKKTLSKIQRRQQDLRERLWPKFDQEQLYNSKNRGNWTPIPRLMPILLQIMNDIAGSGLQISDTYLALWCREWGTGVVTSPGEEALAWEAGFTGQRARNTWRKRMNVLVEHGFIQTSPGVSGDYHYILMLDPLKIIFQLNEKDAQGAQGHRFEMLLNRMIELGIAEPS